MFELLPQNYYIKQSSLLYYNNTKTSTKLNSFLLNKTKIYKFLRIFLYFNIIQYLKYIIKNNKITGFCFIKYNINLSEKVTKNSYLFDIDFYLRDIQKSI